MIYLDSAAIIKLIHDEPGSADLITWLDTQRDSPLVSSALVEVEVPRAIRRSAPQGLRGVPSALARVSRLEIDSIVRSIAAAFEQRFLRSLDAIHLATATLLNSELHGGLVAFVTYDKRLLEAAGEVGLPTASPGQD